MLQETSIDLKSYPKTREEWWMWFESDFDNILNLIKTFSKDKTAEENLIKYKKTHDRKIIKLLNDCWDEFPEANETYKDTPGWFILSELISEIDLIERDSTNIKLFKHRHTLLLYGD